MSEWQGPELASAPLLVFLLTLPFQLTLAPRFLPNALISVDFAANYLTKIYGLTFGQKPNLRSEVRGMILGGCGCINVGRVWEVWGKQRQSRRHRQAPRRGLLCGGGLWAVSRGMEKEHLGPIRVQEPEG